MPLLTKLRGFDDELPPATVKPPESNEDNTPFVFPSASCLLEPMALLSDAPAEAVPRTESNHACARSVFLTFIHTQSGVNAKPVTDSVPLFGVYTTVSIY